MTELLLEETRFRSSAILGALSGALAGASGPLLLWAMGTLQAPRLAAYCLATAGMGALFGALGASLMGLSLPSRRALWRRRKLEGPHALVEVTGEDSIPADELAAVSRLFRRAGAVRIELVGLAA